MDVERAPTVTMADGEQRIEQAGQARFARIEALRAICCFGVVLAHVWGYSHGWAYEETYGTFWRRAWFAIGIVGVPTFFAASGYLLYLPFARRDFGGGGAADVRQYLLNRARRIFPLYYVSLAIVLIFWTDGGTFEQWWKFALFLQNFSTETEGSVNGVLWSLVVDLHFYFLLPILAWGLARLARGRLRTAVQILLIASIISAVSYYVGTVTLTGMNVRLWQHNLPASFGFLGAGMLLALLRVRMQQRPVPMMAGWFGHSDVWLLAAVPIVGLTIASFKLHPLNAVAAFLILGAVALPLQPGRLVRLFDWRPLAVIGVATFSIYIWQGPVIRGFEGDAWFPTSFVGQMLIVWPVAVAVGMLSYQLIEKPFLARRRTWSPSEVAKNADTAPSESGETPGTTVASAPSAAG